MLEEGADVGAAAEVGLADGLGDVGAARVGRVRIRMTDGPRELAARVREGRPLTLAVETLSGREALAEDLMLGMRMSRGVSDELVAQAAEQLSAVHSVLATLVEQGLVFHKDGRWRPTERGWLCGNELYGALFDLAP